MASRRPPKDPGAMRRITGVVLSLWVDRHSCIIHIDRLQGKKRTLGIFNTSRLEERLEGVSSLNSFLVKKAKLKDMIAIPLTAEKSQELDWNKGDWEIVSVQPDDSLRDIHLLPMQYYVKGAGKGKYLPTMSYCRQSLPPTTEADPPPENVGQILHLLRKLVGAWNNFPLQEILNVIHNNDNFSRVRDFFSSKDEVVLFLKKYPQYFSLKDGNQTVFIPYRFPQEGLNTFLKSNAVVSSQSEQADVAYELIESVNVCKQHVNKLRDRVSQNTPLVLSVGCEGVEPGREGSVTLLQIGTVEGEVFIFDFMATPKREDMFIGGGLKELLEEENIIKVMYDCRDPQASLFCQFGVTLTNVFDISGAYASIWDQCNVMSGPYRPSSPSELLQAFGLHARHKTEEFEKDMSENRLFEKRPLTQEMIEYVVDDAKFWVPMVYENLNRLISPLWRPEFQSKVEKWLEESRIEDSQE